MGNVLDAIKKEIIFSGPQTVSTDFESNPVDIDGIEGPYSIDIEYNGGVGVDMVFTLEVSNDGVNYSTVTDSGQTITDSTGTHIYEIQGSGTSFARIKISVTSGSIDLQEINFVGKRRH